MEEFLYSTLHLLYESDPWSRVQFPLLELLFPTVCGASQPSFYEASLARTRVAYPRAQASGRKVWRELLQPKSVVAEQVWLKRELRKQKVEKRIDMDTHSTS